MPSLTFMVPGLQIVAMDCTTFGIQYRTYTDLSFTDCKEKYKNNQNLYAMMLPPACTVTTVQPKTSFSLSNSNTWASTDVTYSFTLSKPSHVIIMYQYSGYSSYSHNYSSASQYRLSTTKTHCIFDWEHNLCWQLWTVARFFEQWSSQY